MSDFAPSRFWYAEKDGTPVAKFDTEGQTRIALPDGINAVSVDSKGELDQLDTDSSVLTSQEADTLGIPS